MDGIHLPYMQRCLDLAMRGLGNTLTNPLVGCVIVNDGEIISEGWHRKYGEAHAERMAIDSIKNDARLKNSTVYVNLEPCSHHGKTPPCAEYIVENGITKVVYGISDPYPEVSGKGIQYLLDHGVQVTGPVLAEESAFINRRFITFQTKKRPYIILKWAESADGFIAGDSKSRVQISGREAQVLLHKWRSEEMAVLVGANTSVIDQPQLNVREWAGNAPVRIFLDGSLRGNYVSGNGNTLVFNKTKNENDGDLTFIQCSSENFIPEMLEYAYQRGINSILVEGGAHTIDSFYALDLWDEIRMIKSKKMELISGIAAPSIKGVEIGKMSANGDTILIHKR